MCDLAARGLTCLVDAVVLENVVDAALESTNCQILLNVKVVHIVKPILLVTPREDIQVVVLESIISFDKAGFDFLDVDAQHGRIYAGSPVDGCGCVALDAQVDGRL